MEITLVDDSIVENLCILVGSDAWYCWLGTIKSFRYQPAQTAKYTLRSDITVRNRTKDYWYAYRKVNCKQRTYYLGKTSELSYEKLQMAVDELSLSNTEYVKLISERKAVVHKKVCTTVRDNSTGCTKSMYNTIQALDNWELKYYRLEDEYSKLKAAYEKLYYELKQFKVQH